MIRTPDIAVLGAGTVGTAAVRLLDARPGLRVRSVLVRDTARPRGFDGWRERVTDRPEVAIDGASIVVEAMGGTGLATDLMLRALAAGARVVTANKAALAERWEAFVPHLARGRLYLEASVMAGTPVIGPLTGSVRGSRPVALHAILNGTCNVILARMEQGASFGEALAEAQREGYAEADPTLDVDGLDAAHKLAVLARLTVDPALSWERVRSATLGIRRVRASQLAAAAAVGTRVRLVASLLPSAHGWEAEVRPRRLPLGHPLLAAEHVRNALWLRAEPLGEIVLLGPGAGGGATGSALVGDVLQAAAGRPGPTPLERAVPVPGSGAVDVALDPLPDEDAA